MKMLPLLSLTFLSVSALAQVPAPTPTPLAIGFERINRTADLSLATNGDVNTASLSVNRLRGLGRSHRFRIGYGLRLTSAFGRGTDFRTAPSRLIKGPGRESALGLFAPNREENLDTLRVTNLQAHALNISLNLEYAVSRRVELGFNIDLIGFTVGPDRTGTFTANSPVRSPLSGTEQYARLTSFNILLGDQSDRGSLNTEGYVRYRISPRASVRAGGSLLVNEYTTTRTLTFDNDRFRSNSYRVVVAISYHF